MRTIHMGLNTEPDFLRADVIKARWEARGDKEMVATWERAKHISEDLRDQIIAAVEEDGECKLSWGCSGRSRHQMHAHQWADALPQYDFEIGYNYHCVVRKRS